MMPLWHLTRFLVIRTLVATKSRSAQAELERRGREGADQVFLQLVDLSLVASPVRAHRNILIVGDSRFLRLANERALIKAGHNVITAPDGEEGLHFTRKRKPDLVILDMMLPKRSGQEVLHALRGDPETAVMPVIVLTSLPQCNGIG
jgi:PleD family two-component response regulator